MQRKIYEEMSNNVYKWRGVFFFRILFEYMMHRG